MKALSVRAPWWWYIVRGYKDIENRDWYSGYRGEAGIHASKWWNTREVEADLRYIHEEIMEPGIVEPPTLDELRRFGGHLVGQARIADCVRAHNSRWFFGAYGFVLRDAVAFVQTIPFKGALGFFNVPEELLR